MTLLHTHAQSADRITWRRAVKPVTRNKRESSCSLSLAPGVVATGCRQSAPHQRRGRGRGRGYIGGAEWRLVVSLVRVFPGAETKAESLLLPHVCAPHFCPVSVISRKQTHDKVYKYILYPLHMCVT